VLLERLPPLTVRELHVDKKNRPIRGAATRFWSRATQQIPQVDNERRGGGLLGSCRVHQHLDAPVVDIVQRAYR
jgi:hypothetical protein